MCLETERDAGRDHGTELHTDQSLQIERVNARLLSSPAPSQERHRRFDLAEIDRLRCYLAGQDATSA
jgi:hypothetical protein